MYEIRFDGRQGILYLTLTGFWTAEVLAGFAAELLRTVAAIARSHASFAVLSDSRAFPVQSPEVSAGFARLMSGSEGRGSGKRAIVVASALNKMQAERVLAAPNLRVFLDMDDAVAWLAAPTPATRTEP